MKVLRKEHGSVTLSPFGNYDRPTDRLTNQLTVDRWAHRKVTLPIRLCFIHLSPHKKKVKKNCASHALGVKDGPNNG